MTLKTVAGSHISKKSYYWQGRLMINFEGRSKHLAERHRMAHTDDCGHCKGDTQGKAPNDPYGALTPSNIPRPGQPTGEPIPRPGLPAQYPHYLRPIPVNTRNIRNILNDYINAQEPELVRWLYSTWSSGTDPIKYQELRNAIKTGELSQSLIDAWRADYIDLVNNSIIPQWEAAARAGHGALSPGIIAANRGVPHEATAARMAEWIRVRGGELIVNMTRQQVQAIRGVLHHYTVENPINPRELGRLIRPMVGLTQGQATAVSKYRQALLAEGMLTPDQIIHQVENYSAYLHRIRAQRIAQTEMAFAFNQAGLETMREARDMGAGTVTKTLLSGRDDKTCDLCGPLDGVTIELEETYPGATARLPSVFAPPLHPNCRCTLLYGIIPS